MRPAEFRKRLYSRLSDVGSQTHGGQAIKDSSDVRVIVRAGTDAVSHGLSVSFGLFLKSIAATPPEVYHHCHIYGGVGNLAPRLHALDLELYRKSADAMTAYLDAVPVELTPALEDLFDVQKVAEALERGTFSRCLILREARAWLTDDSIERCRISDG